ncbi:MULTISPECIES: hypothetical protein [unclassified Streptomyces]|uniref:hypothetical protein n=1 Tax=unclassified Streptomyces TaxID=2593676 RepID=UPI0003828856|nr:MULTISPECIES: hypothetical protein [unclassified Streptomyces]MYT28302.1 hypothetical protein [Streptomyces sp. SID8354]
MEKLTEDIEVAGLTLNVFCGPATANTNYKGGGVTAVPGIVPFDDAASYDVCVVDTGIGVTRTSDSGNLTTSCNSVTAINATGTVEYVGTTDTSTYKLDTITAVSLFGQRGGLACGTVTGGKFKGANVCELFIRASDQILNCAIPGGSITRSSGANYLLIYSTG